MKYVLIDLHNLFHRACFAAKGSAELRGGMALHIMLNLMAQAWKAFNADHVMVALECKSTSNWRVALEGTYKQNRRNLKDAKTSKEAEDDKVLYTMLNNFMAFLKDRTNVSVLHCDIAEADDLIARWVHLHPEDDHIIISNDKDFHQLLSANVCQFNGVSKILYKSSDSRLKPTLPKYWKEEIISDPNYSLFEKIIRGDTSDNIFAAYPGVRKISKTKPSINAAYADIKNKGFDWNNFMMQKWTDHHGNDHLVKCRYEHNKALIDLSSQPEDIKTYIDDTIKATITEKAKMKIAFQFSKFCNENELEQIAERFEEFVEILSATYKCT